MESRIIGTDFASETRFLTRKPSTSSQSSSDAVRLFEALYGSAGSQNGGALTSSQSTFQIPNSQRNLFATSTRLTSAMAQLSALRGGGSATTSLPSGSLNSTAVSLVANVMG